MPSRNVLLGAVLCLFGLLSGVTPVCADPGLSTYVAVPPSPNFEPVVDLKWDHMQGKLTWSTALAMPVSVVLLSAGSFGGSVMTSMGFPLVPVGAPVTFSGIDVSGGLLSLAQDYHFAQVLSPAEEHDIVTLDEIGLSIPTLDQRTATAAALSLAGMNGLTYVRVEQIGSTWTLGPTFLRAITLDIYGKTDATVAADVRARIGSAGPPTNVIINLETESETVSASESELESELDSEVQGHHHRRRHRHAHTEAEAGAGPQAGEPHPYHPDSPSFRAKMRDVEVIVHYSYPILERGMPDPVRAFRNAHPELLPRPLVSLLQTQEQEQEQQHAHVLDLELDQSEGHHHHHGRHRGHGGEGRRRPHHRLHQLNAHQLNPHGQDDNDDSNDNDNTQAPRWLQEQSKKFGVGKPGLAGGVQVSPDVRGVAGTMGGVLISGALTAQNYKLWGVTNWHVMDGGAVGSNGCQPARNSGTCDAVGKLRASCCSTGDRITDPAKKMDYAIIELSESRYNTMCAVLDHVEWFSGRAPSAFRVTAVTGTGHALPHEELQKYGERTHKTVGKAIPIVLDDTGRVFKMQSSILPLFADGRKCGGTCQDPATACGVAYQTGKCGGTLKCCPSAVNPQLSPDNEPAFWTDAVQDSLVAQIMTIIDPATPGVTFTAAKAALVFADLLAAGHVVSMTGTKGDSGSWILKKNTGVVVGLLNAADWFEDRRTTISSQGLTWGKFHCEVYAYAIRDVVEYINGANSPTVFRVCSEATRPKPTPTDCSTAVRTGATCEYPRSCRVVSGKCQARRDIGA